MNVGSSSVDAGGCTAMSWISDRCSYSVPLKNSMETVPGSLS